MAVAHLTFDFRPRHKCGHRVDDQNVQRAGTDQHVGDLQCLLTGIGLGHQQRIGVDAQILGVLGVERVLGVDERRDAAGGLGVGHRVQGDGGLTRGLRAVDLHDAAAGQAADAQGDVQCDRPGRDDRDGLAHLVAEAHHRTFAVTLLDLGHRQFESLLAVRGLRHGATSRCSRCSARPVSVGWP